MAYTSPGLCSPGLIGTQGWSPSSSVYSDECEDSSFVMTEPKRRSVEFPLPPKRARATRPLSLIKPRAVSAKVQQQRRVLDAWGFSSEESEFGSGVEDSEVVVDALGIITHAKPRSARRNAPTHLQLPSYTRRVVSAPAPPAYSDIHNIDEDSEAEPDEYPFPIMPTHRNSQRTALGEEKEKLRRLQASMALLAFDEKHDDMKTMGGERWMSPLHHISILSPEYRAPSLEEQMAYASGLGSQCSWSSPHKLVRASSDHYVSRKPIEVSTMAQEERKMASRHVRQGVAAIGSAPLSRTTSVAANVLGEEAEVGSSWSHKGCEEEGDEEDEGQYWIHGSRPMGRSFSQHSAAVSTIVSVNSSPILHGALSAADFTSHHSNEASSDSEMDSPSTCATSVQSHQVMRSDKLLPGDNGVTCLFSRSLAIEEVDDASSSAGSEDSVATPSDSPYSMHEFSYIIDSNELTALSPTPALNHPFGEDDFDGNTFSPALKTPELGPFANTPLDMVPSPVLEQKSIMPLSLCADENANVQSSVPRSMSSSSVLERPRPFSRSATTSFFAGAPALRIREQMTTSISEMNLASRRAPSKDAASIKKPARLTIPTASRKSSLEVSTPASAGHNSVQAFFEENEQALLPPLRRKPVPSVSFLDSPSKVTVKSSAASLPASQSEMSIRSRRLSARGLAQVKEACRAKADYARNCALNEEEALEAAMASCAKATLTTNEVPVLVRRGQSSPSNLIASAYGRKKTGKTSPSSLSSSSLPTSASSNRSMVALSNSEQVPMPTLFIARTDNQRKKGITGVPATEPGLLALAKLGFRTPIASRQSTVEALIHRPDALQEGGVLKNMPDGVVLIVEEEHVVVSYVIVA